MVKSGNFEFGLQCEPCIKKHIYTHLLADLHKTPMCQVLSGSEWGNMLLWDGGLIKVEICRKGGKTCHAGTIQHLSLDEGELLTIGTDGAVRVRVTESPLNSPPMHPILSVG